ncbi:glycoside hydrolase family 88 protein, partial [Enterococcus faecium]|uniref:glycoside hydrolase family 88 protein n=1 Tax=Enterococcus faecium TaxID=1352 RepID=UPI0031CD2053
IDSLINLPVLFQACTLSNDPHYKEVAFNHYQTLFHTVIREDATTFHTYYFDSNTGVPTHGPTHQGHSDESIWARGQSWAILGIPLNERYLHSVRFPLNYK